MELAAADVDAAIAEQVAKFNEQRAKCANSTCRATVDSWEAAAVKKIKKKSKMEKAEEDQKALASGLMSRRTRKMYTHVKRAENKKAAGVEELKRKRKEAESKAAKKPKK